MLFKIGQVAKLVGVKTHTIRFWEKNFPHIASKHNKGATRYYDSFCISEFMKIKNMMYDKGIKISGILKLVENDSIKEKQIRKSTPVEKISKNDSEIIKNRSDFEIEYNKKLKKNILKNILILKDSLKNILQTNAI